MKILTVIAFLAPIYGGTSKTVIDLAQAITPLGVSMDIIATHANGTSNLDVPLQTWIDEPFGRIQYFPYWQVGDYPISSTMTTWLFRHVADYDLVHIHTVFSYPVLPTYWACRWHHVPYVRTPHGMLEPWALSYKAWKKRVYYPLFEQPALEHASALHALTISEAENIHSLNLKAPIVIIPNGIHYQEFESLPNPEAFYKKFFIDPDKTIILFLGRIDPKKGLDLLAPAFAMVNRQFPQTHLVLAGPDIAGFLPTAQGFFAQAGCSDAVTFTGMLTGVLKYEALAAASLFVAPYYSEGFSMSVLEGMAAGLPCVITTGCNFPEAAAANVAHVVDIDADAIAHALINCLSETQTANVMGQQARNFIFQNYTWNRAAELLKQVYSTIITQQSLPGDITFIS